MTDPEKEMESYLSRFRRKVPPPGFKEQLLGRVEERRKLEQAITPPRWKIAVACLALIVIFLGANFFINRTEERYLSAFLDINRPLKPELSKKLCLPSWLMSRNWPTSKNPHRSSRGGSGKKPSPENKRLKSI